LSKVKAHHGALPHFRAMTRYHIRFLNHAGLVYGQEELCSPSDQTAIEQARRLHRHGIGMGYEIWDGERHVHTESHH
jgi:hypothetical protein